MPDVHAFTIAVRWLHVASMAVALGGAGLLSTFAWGAEDGDRRRVLLTLASRYEFLFWGALGLLAMSGVGNIAAFGTGLPAPNSAWGAILTIKLGLVIAIATLSVPRTLIVSLLSSSTSVTAERALAALRSSYMLTTIGLAIVLALAVWLAHL